MNAFTRLLSLPPARQDELGVRHTAAEIHQQPDVWPLVAEVLVKERLPLLRFLEEADIVGQEADIAGREAGSTGRGGSAVVLTGAGTSEYIGNAIWPTLRARLGREVLSYPTTHLVTHPQAALPPGRGLAVVSFSRSGDSPESLAAWRIVRRLRPDAWQLAVTCNAEGGLARLAAGDPRAFRLLLPERTNDRSLAMTSAYTSMALAGLGLSLLGEPDRLITLVSLLSRSARRVMDGSADRLKAVAARPFDRACYLGSGPLYGAAQEAALKMTELNAGRVATVFNSFLGIRHGPQVFINAKCLVVALLSGDERVRRYERDLLRELRAKGQGLLVLGICAADDGGARALCDEWVEVDPEVEDDYRLLTDVAACQVLALFKSLRNRLRPDSPSAGGIINRVVQGVTIHED